MLKKVEPLVLKENYSAATRLAGSIASTFAALAAC
jgi:hypothetical protein